MGSTLSPPVDRSDDPGRRSSGVGSSGDATGIYGASSSTPVTATTPSSGTCVRATSRVILAANLDSASSPIDGPWEAADPYANTNYIQVVTIFDALDQEHSLSIAVRRTESHSFEYHAIVDAYSGVPHRNGGTEVSSGVLSFTAGGALDSVSTTTESTVAFDGQPPQTIAVDFGSSIEEGGSGLDASISVAGGFSTAAAWQDGGTCRLERAAARPCAWPMPEATSRVTLSGNVDPTTTDGVLPVPPWDVNHPAVTSHVATVMTVFDSLGASHDIGLYLRRTGPTTWDYHALLDETPVATRLPSATEVGTGTLSFDATGQLWDVAVTRLVALSFPDAEPGQPVALDFGGTSGSGDVTALGSVRSAMVASGDGQSIPSDVLLHPAICN